MLIHPIALILLYINAFCFKATKEKCFTIYTPVPWNLCLRITNQSKMTQHQIWRDANVDI